MTDMYDWDYGYELDKLQRCPVCNNINDFFVDDRCILCALNPEITQ